MAKREISSPHDMDHLEILREYFEGSTGVLGSFENWSKKELANLFFYIYDKSPVSQLGNDIAEGLDKEGWLVDNTIIIKVG